MRKLILCFIVGLCPLFADHFRDGMIAYKAGHFVQAKEAFEIAIKKENSIQGYFYIGKIYLHGEGVDANPPLAIPYLEQAAMKGNVKAKCYLAEAYLKSNIKQDEARLLLKQGAKESSTCQDIATMYHIAINS
jgi:TPR repeat protein